MDQLGPDESESLHVLQEVRLGVWQWLALLGGRSRLATRDGRHPDQQALEDVLRCLVRLYPFDPQIVRSMWHNFSLDKVKICFRDTYTDLDMVELYDLLDNLALPRLSLALLSDSLPQSIGRPRDVNL